MRIIFGAVLLMLSIIDGLHAKDEPVQFSDPILEKRYHALLEEIRCLVCQNQSLIDSNADLAQDLRDKIHQMLEQGASEQEIIQFLVDRYGDFVRYRPPFRGDTALLWLGPFLFLLIAPGVAVFMVRRQAKQNDPSHDNNEGKA